MKPPRQNAPAGRDATRHAALCEAVLAAQARGGEVVIRARGRSMRPMIRAGEEVRIRALGARPVRPGDVVLARTPGGAVLHRVITLHPPLQGIGGAAQEGSGVLARLKGDGEPRADALLPLGAVLGRADAVRRRGRWIRLDAPWRALLARCVSVHLAPRPLLRRLARRLVPSAFL